LSPEGLTEVESLKRMKKSGFEGKKKKKGGKQLILLYMRNAQV